jgi:alpha-L-fucosidase
MKDAVNDATSKAIIPLVRFTKKGDDLYVFVCSWHEKKVLIKSLASNKCKIIKEISMLGDTKNVKWEQSDNGLALKMPSSFLKEIPVVGFKIRFQNY